MTTTPTVPTPGTVDPKQLEDALRAVQQTQTAMTQLQQDQIKLQKELAEAKKPKRTVPVPDPKDPAAQAAALQEFANDTQRENQILHAAMEFGLKTEDFEGQEFQSPTEIRLFAQNVKLQQQMSQLVQDAADQRTQLETLQQVAVATGKIVAPVPKTVSGGGLEQLPAPSTEATEDEELKAGYARAKAQGRTQQGAMRFLDTVHKDPSKIIR